MNGARLAALSLVALLGVGHAGATSGDAETERLVRAGAEALGRRDLEVALERFRTALARDGARVDARIGLAAAAISLDRDHEALPVVLDGLARAPHEPALHELLGDLRDREERVGDALTAWRTAFDLAPNDRLRDKIMKGERELAAARAYDTAAAPHFTLRFDGEADAALAADIVDHLEASYRELTDLLRHAPAQPITVLLYPKQTFRSVTQTTESVAGLYDGKIRVPLGGLRALDTAARAVLTHELAHAIVHAKTRGTCPRWLHEGIAQRAEGRRRGRWDPAPLVSRIARGRLDLDGRDFSYEGARSLLAWLEDDRGFHAVVEVLDRLGGGEPLDRALADVYGEGLHDLSRRWLRDVAEGRAGP